MATKKKLSSVAALKAQIQELEQIRTDMLNRARRAEDRLKALEDGSSNSLAMTQMRDKLEAVEAARNGAEAVVRARQTQINELYARHQGELKAITKERDDFAAEVRTLRGELQYARQHIDANAKGSMVVFDAAIAERNQARMHVAMMREALKGIVRDTDKMNYIMPQHVCLDAKVALSKLPPEDANEIVVLDIPSILQTQNMWLKALGFPEERMPHSAASAQSMVELHDAQLRRAVLVAVDDTIAKMTPKRP